jgi:hypothetical protein
VHPSEGGATALRIVAERLREDAGVAADIVLARPGLAADIDLYARQVSQLAERRR